MFESKNNQDLMDLVLACPGATEAELALVERLSLAIAEIDRLTELVRAQGGVSGENP